MTANRKRFISMFAKLSIAFIAVSTVIFAGVVYSALNSSKEALAKQKTEDMSLYLERTAQYLDLYLHNTRNILLGVSQRLADPAVQQQPNAVRDILSETVRLNSENVSHMFVMDEQGNVVSSNQVIYEIIGNPRLSTIFQIAKDNPGIITWSAPYYAPLLVSDTVAFTLYVKPKDGSEGYVVAAEINTHQLNRQIGDLLFNKGQTFALFSAQGEVIAYDRASALIPAVPLSLPKEMDPNFQQTLMNLSNGIGRVQWEHSSFLSVKSNRNQLGWYLVSLTDEEVFGKSILELGNRIMLFGVIWFVLMLVAATWISRHFTKPIRRLAHQMERMDASRITLPVQPVIRNDEIGLMSDSFYTMLARIRELLETIKETEARKKTLELKLLLSQIRPHFLYNTLSCIGSLAKQHRAAEVEETIRSLITILSFSIDKKREFVLLEEELDTLKAYIQIQKVRYGDTFQYVTDVPQEHRAYRVPKLLLQPLAENALFHGIAAQGYGTIRIRSEVRDQVLHLYVEDDGSGISPERLAEVMTRQLSGHETGAMEPPPAAGGLNSMGLSNVQERLQLNYGPEFGLNIGPRPAGGTMVELRLPASLY